MAYYKEDEMVITKATSIRLADDMMLIITLQYNACLKDKTASRYRFLGRVVRISDVQKRISELLQDDMRLGNWQWPDDPSWNGKIYTSDSSNYQQARWLRMKITKLLSWEDGVNRLHGYEKKHGHSRFNPNAKFETEGYIATDGSIVSLLDKETLIKKVGQNLVKEIRLRSKRVPIQTSVKLTEEENTKNLESTTKIA